MTMVPPAPPETSPETVIALKRLSADVVAFQALDLLRSWTEGKPGDADETIVKHAVDTVMLVHGVAREATERTLTP